jgi:hypothetical protein
MTTARSGAESCSRDTVARAGGSAERADVILRQHGAVFGSQRYAERHLARYRAQKLIHMLVALGLHRRIDLREHTEQHVGGWVWAVELRPIARDSHVPHSAASGGP